MAVWMCRVFGPRVFLRLRMARCLNTEAEIELSPFKLYNLDVGPSETAQLSRDDALRMYRTMYTVRRMEHMCADLYKTKEIRGFLHLYAGEEAVATGMKEAMRPDDSVITAYRCHSFAYLMGCEPKAIIAELMGRVTGSSLGRGGSMHLYAQNFYGGNGIVGAQVPLGAGVALAYKLRKESRVCFALYGDGAANQGQVFESYNMAALWSLPVVFICENNGYAMGTSTKRSSANDSYFTRCEYIPGIWVNGMDVVAVREATRFAINHCTEGRGPLIMEMNCYRYYGHSMADPGVSYRTRDEVAAARKTRDPIVLFKDIIVAKGLAEEGEMVDLNNSIKKEINAAAEEARADPMPDVSTLAQDVLVKPLRPIVRGTLHWQTHAHQSSNRLINKLT